MSLPDALLVLFVGLKLAGLIEWSWVWVTTPFWIPMASAFVVSFLAAITGRGTRARNSQSE